MYYWIWMIFCNVLWWQVVTAYYILTSKGEDVLQNIVYGSIGLTIGVGLYHLLSFALGAWNVCTG